VRSASRRWACSGRTHTRGPSRNPGSRTTSTASARASWPLAVKWRVHASTAAGVGLVDPLEPAAEPPGGALGERGVGRGSGAQRLQIAHLLATPRRGGHADVRPGAFGGRVPHRERVAIRAVGAPGSVRVADLAVEHVPPHAEERARHGVQPVVAPRAVRVVADRVRRDRREAHAAPARVQLGAGEVGEQQVRAAPLVVRVRRHVALPQPGRRQDAGPGPPVAPRDLLPRRSRRVVGQAVRLRHHLVGHRGVRGEDVAVRPARGDHPLDQPQRLLVERRHDPARGEPLEGAERRRVRLGVPPGEQLHGVLIADRVAEPGIADPAPRGVVEGLVAPQQRVELVLGGVHAAQRHRHPHGPRRERVAARGAPEQRRQEERHGLTVSGPRGPAAGVRLSSPHDPLVRVDLRL
jgi:hypothetical protein